MSDWIDWNGGECPVFPETRVDARFLGGGQIGNTHAGGLKWERVGALTDIVAYRVIRKQTQEQKPSALARQEGGGHYKDLKIQPIEYIHANGIPFAEGSVIKYVTRWRAKGGVKDLEKARHFLDLLIELESRNG